MEKCNERVDARMRARNIKPGFFKSEGLASCSPYARLLFIGMWCMADREGKLEDRPLRFKAEIFPYENVNIEKLINELTAKTDCDGEPSFIRRYGDKKKYIHIIHFLSHQNPHIREQASAIPDFTPCTMQGTTLTMPSMEQALLIPDSLLLNPDILKPDKRQSAYDYFSDFWKEYPRKKDRVPAQNAFAKLKMNDSLMDKLMSALYRDIESKEWQEYILTKQENFIPYGATWINKRRWEDGT